MPAKKAKQIKKDRLKYPLSEAEELRAQNVWRLLEHWTRVPGTTSNDSFNGVIFKRWVKVVFAKARKMDLIRPARMVLAHVLIHAPADADGFWMPHEVAELMEMRTNVDMLESYRIAKFNSRGVQFVDKGMKKDLASADQCRKMAEEAEEQGYGHIAEMMRELAEEIQAMAHQWQDEDALRVARFEALKAERRISD